MNTNPNPNPNPEPKPEGASGLPGLPNVGGITSGIENISKSIDEAKSGLNNAVGDFSSKTAVDASSEFLESNTIVAKFAFIIIVLIGFMLLFRLGVVILSYFLSPSGSPYLVKGQIDGNEAIEITQDARSSNPLIKFSENKNSGIEFTYSVWLYLNGQADTAVHHIFNKGEYDSASAVKTAKSHSPSLSVKTVKATGTDVTVKTPVGTSTLIVKMDTMADVTDTGSSSNSESLEITNIPHKKWTNVIIRLQNRILDVYVNGVLTNREDLGYIPRQNFGSVFVCQNGGFAGKLSDLRYHDSALNVFQINQIVTSGPNTSTSSSSTSPSSGYYYYLSSQFYKNNV
jgi:hypothetical protein